MSWFRSPIPDYLCSRFPGVCFRCKVLYTRFRRLKVRFYLPSSGVQIHSHFLLRCSSASRGENLPAVGLCSLWLFRPLSERGEQDTRFREKPSLCSSSTPPERRRQQGFHVAECLAEQSLPPGALCHSSCHHGCFLTSLCRLVTPILSAE